MPSPSAPGWAVRRVTPADVGARVTLRRVLAGGGYADTLGELLAFADGLLQVRRRTGEVVTVVDADVVASKVIPPLPVQPPARSRTT